MPTTDSYGQGIAVAALTDAPNAETLARNIVDAIVPQTIMRFDSASNRNATLTAPVAGMMAWLRTERLLTEYDGTAWAVVAAGSQAWTDVPLVAGFAHDGNSNGRCQYRLVNFFGEPTIMLRGAVAVTYSGTTIPNDGVINSVPLPPAARPTTLRTITITCSDKDSARITLKLDIKPEGYLKVLGTGVGEVGTATPPWISFNGCFSSL